MDQSENIIKLYGNKSTNNSIQINQIASHQSFKGGYIKCSMGAYNVMSITYILQWLLVPFKLLEFERKLRREQMFHYFLNRFLRHGLKSK